MHCDNVARSQADENVLAIKEFAGHLETRGFMASAFRKITTMTMQIADHVQSLAGGSALRLDGLRAVHSPNERVVCVRYVYTWCR